MKISESQSKALTILFQSIITALLLFAQSFFSGCVSAQGDVNQENNIEISVPSFKDALKLLRMNSDSLVLSLDDFEDLDNELVLFRQELANNFYSLELPYVYQAE